MRKIAGSNGPAVAPDSVGASRFLTGIRRWRAKRHAAVLFLAGALVSCGGGGGDTNGDAPPATGDGGGGSPSVSIASPTPGSTVSGNIDVTADVTIGAGIAGVQFQVDGANIDAEDTVAPYSVAWDTTTASDGSHELTAIARDMAGNLFTSAPVTITSANTSQPPGPPSPARVEETNAAVTLSANWTQATPDWYAWSGGAAVRSAVPGAKATYTFTADSVTWIGQRSNVSGIARVRVDADPTGVLVDLFAHNVETNSPVFSVNGLSPGSHTLTIEVTGDRNPGSQGSVVVVDAFVVPAPVVSHLQETDPDVAFTGVWAQADDRFGWSGGGLATVPDPPVGGARVSESSGAKATLTFTGTAVNWMGFRGRDGGIARVQVDGGPAITVDTYSPADKVQAVVFTATGLADVTHTLTIEALGTKSAASTGRKIVVDAFDVTTPGRRYQEEDPAVVYSPGNWIFKNLNRTWSEGSISESSVDGAFVTFSFTGTSVSWIGCRKLSTGGANIFIDGNLVQHVETFEPAPIEAYQTTIFRIDGLSPGPHVLKIVVAGSGPYTVIDAFDVRP